VDINQAALELNNALEGLDWFAAVAVGGLGEKEVIFVYTTRSVANKWTENLRSYGWRGFDVRVEKVGRPQPANR
jgi:hypothetical protein